MTDVLTNEALFASTADLVFRDGRTIKKFAATPLPGEVIPRVEELTYLGPTSMNSQPLRIVWLRSPDAQERLLPHLAELNRDKARSAPLIAVLSSDSNWHEEFAYFSPAFAERRDLFASDLPLREKIANDNAHLEAGYFILAVRAVGLSAGPMTAFDAGGVVQEFGLPETWHPFMIVNIGLPAAGEPAFPRQPRMDASGRATRVV